MYIILFNRQRESTDGDCWQPMTWLFFCGLSLSKDKEVHMDKSILAHIQGQYSIDSFIFISLNVI